MTSPRFRTLRVLLALGLGPAASAQTLIGHDGFGAVALEIQTPPAGPCAYPSGGPLVGAFPTAAILPCPFPGVTPPALVPLGDVAFDKTTDTVWVTDGFVIGSYTMAGVPLSGFAMPPGAVLPGPLTGLGYDPVAGMLWITDGAFMAAIVPPPPPGCALPLAVALPVPVAAPATDIEWDPITGTLWVCDAGGIVTNVTPGGLIGPLGAFAAGVAGCPLAAPLQGIAVDTTAPATLYVTDGIMISRMVVPAAGVPAPAPPTFFAPFACYPAGVPPLNGLAFTEHGITYGAGLDNSGAPAPTIGSFGNSFVGNPGFGITLSGSVPGSIARCYYSTGTALCPSFPVLGLPLLIFPPSALGTAIVGAGGTATLVVPLGAVPPGVTVWMQWLGITPLPSLQMSDGLSITTGLP